MELARVFSAPGRADRPHRSASRSGTTRRPDSNGARAYVEQRQALQGKEDPGRLGQVSRAEVARHDPARHDDVRPRHAARRRHDAARSSAPRPTSTSSSSRRRSWPPSAQKLAWVFAGREREVRDRLSGAVGQHMTNTDSGPFQDIVAGDQPARERARRADRRRLGSAVAPADRRLRDLQRQGFPARPERRADDARGGGAADRREVAK